PVGDEGVRRTGCDAWDAVAGTHVVVVAGTWSEIPEIGESWRSADVRAGVRVVRVCRARPFATQTRRVLVDSHRGRRDPNRPQIELATDRPASRIWWGRAPGEESGCEISAEQKVALLESLYRQSGRIDMNRSYVNVTTW